MDVFHIFSQRKRTLDTLKTARDGRNSEVIEPCPKCAQAVRMTAVFTCPKCGHHYKMPAKERLEWLLDHPRSLARFDNIVPRNPLDFPGYDDKLMDAHAKTGLSDAYYCRVGKLGGRTLIALALEPDFMMGSMGTAVGEAVTRAFEVAREKQIPLIIFSASGGARMQEGMFSLMQMAKTSGAARALSDEGGLFISVLTNPTTGGVTASFASLGDIIIAEPGALIGFAGPRVIEQTIGAKLPDGFQSAEFQLEHGFVDAVIPRTTLKKELSKLLTLHPDRRER